MDRFTVFERMRPFQLTAIKYLQGHAYLRAAETGSETLLRTGKPPPDDLLPNADRLNEGQQYVLSLVASPFNELTLYGPSGLKSRTRLIDYKYDPV